MPVPSAPAATPRPRAFPAPDWTVIACGAALAAAAFAAYSPSFAVPLLFDDDTAITGNTTLRHLASALRPPPGTTVSGRPVLNLSLAANYALNGADVQGFHAVNLAIHVLAGLTLLGIVRRTLAPGMGRAAVGFAFAASLLWTLHPLLTESVTYIVQRAESLMGLFYLLTLYGFIRGARAQGRAASLWFGVSAAACVLGMGTKEVMISAPLVVLLYDRTFLAGSFREALRRRRAVYGALAASWILLLYLVLEVDGRSGSAGFGVGIPWWRYALAQPPAIVHYLRLCFWPSGLVFDYGSALGHRSAAVVASGVAVAALAAVTAWALVKRPPLGFLGVSFFALLAPSSSIVPVATEAMAEHRMYLPLIPVVVLAVAALRVGLGRASVPLCVVAAAALGWATFQRNETYRTEVGIWRDTVEKRPGNARAQDNLGYALSKVPGSLDEAIAHYEAALRLDPDLVEAHYNLAYALLSKPGRLDDVIAHYAQALRLKPDLVDVRFNLARALETLPGRTDEAIAQYEEVVRRRPDFAEARYNLGYMLQANPGRLGDAAAQFEAFLRLRPDSAGAHFSLACALASLPGRREDAVAHFEAAIRLKPDYVEARCDLGNALHAMGRSAEAADQYAAAVRLQPDNARIHLNFAVILLDVPGRTADASAHLREALRLDPDNARARQLLDRLNATPQ